MADPRQPSDDELRVLRGLEQLPDPQRYGAWVLRGKDVRGVHVDDNTLGDLLWDDVSFSDMHWTGSALRRAQIQRCRFVDVGFTRCVIEDVLFVDCKLINLQTSDVQFRRCRFERCEFSSLYSNTTVFDECTFDAAHMLGADMRDATFQGCALRGCDFEFMRVAASRLMACAFDQGSLRNSRFSYVDSQDIGFTRTEFEQCTFVGGAHQRWQIAAATGNGLKFVSVQLRDLHVDGCDAFADLRIATSQVHALQVTNSSGLTALGIFRSEVTALHVADSVLLAANFEEAAIGPSSVIEGVAFHGLTISDSRLTRPQFIRCRFSEYFYLYRTEFHSLVADDVRYAAGLREIHDAVTYASTSAHLGSRP